MNISLPKLILFALVGVFVAQIMFYYPNLPAQIATHFDELGRPSEIMPKRLFMTFEAALLLLILTETTLIPVIVERLPSRFVNIPNRGYWLAEERRAETFAAIRRAFDSLGVVLVTFFIVINQIVFRANIMRENLSALVFFAFFGVFLIVMIGWMYLLIRRFRVVKPL